MEQNKEQLEKLLQFIDQLGQNPDNAWFMESLKNKYSETSKSSTKSSIGKKIDHIYEYCIQEVIRKQAEEFYQNFPIKSLISDLVEDYVRMEFFHRMDDFGDFCLALYQQIENTTNKLCEDSELNDIANIMWAYPAYVKSKEYNSIIHKFNIITPSISNRMDSDYIVAQLVFPGTNKKTNIPFYLEKSKNALQSQYALDKIRNIVYFVGYKAKLRTEDYDNYVNFTNLLSDIYNCRNMNHRGSTLNEWERSVQNRIIPMKSFHYFKFIGGLAQYVDFVKSGYPEIHTIAEFARSLTHIKIEKPVLGHIDVSKYSKGYNKNGNSRKIRK